MSLPAYASSLSATRQLVGHILQDVFESCLTSEVDSVAELGYELITTDKKPFQRYWSSAVHEALFLSLKAGAPPSRLARILTAAQGHSGDWITACPIAQVGTRLDDETLQISVALRIGLNVCLAHRCCCGPSSIFMPFQCWSISSTLRDQQHHKKITRHCWPSLHSRTTRPRSWRRQKTRWSDFISL